MLPREVRNTRNSARSSSDRPQNSQAWKSPEISVPHALQPRRVSASSEPHTGHALGAERAPGRLFVGGHLDAAHFRIDLKAGGSASDNSFRGAGAPADRLRVG